MNPILHRSFVLTELLLATGPQASAYEGKWVGSDGNVKSLKLAGVTCLPLAASWSKGKLQLTGRFGVFAPGQIRVILYDHAGETISSEIMKEPASPLKPLIVDLTRDAAAQPADVVLEWSSKTRDRQGVLAHSKLRTPALAAP